MTESIDPVKACDQCMYHHSEGDWLDFCDKYTISKVNYVTGKTWEEPRLCTFARDDERLCGPEGKGYDHRGPEPDNSPSFREFVVGFFRLLLS